MVKTSSPNQDLQGENSNSGASTHTENAPSDQRTPQYSMPSKEEKASNADTPASSTKKTRFQLPPWVLTNLKSPRSFKVFLRCWLASWVSFVIILPNPSLRALGTSAFFSILTSFFLPPNMPVQFFLFMISTLVIGLLLGWGIGAAAMRAALASRNAAQLQAATQQLQESIRSDPNLQANPTLAQTVAVFNGLFLDIRSSAVFGCFLGLGAFIFGFLRAYAPKLIMLSIFGTISIDIFCSLGPLFPSSRYNLLDSTLKSVACYIGIACITTIFVFPETMSHSYLSTTCEQLGRIKEIIALQTEVLRSTPAQLGDPTNVVMAKTKGLRALVIGTQKQLLALSGFLPLEFSWGRFNSDDVKDLLEPMLGLASRIAALPCFSKFVGQTATLEAESAGSSVSQIATQTSTLTASNDTYLLHHINQLNLEMESKHNVRMVDMLPLVEKSTAALRNACMEGIQSTRDVLESINKRRWTGKQDTDGALAKALDTSMEQLRMEIAAFKTQNRLVVLEPFMDLMNREVSKPNDPGLPLRALFLSFVFLTTMLAVSESTLSLMGHVKATAMKRKRNRLWAPKGLRKLGNLLMQRDASDDGIAVTGEDASPLVVDVTNEKEYRRDPDSAPPTNVVQRIMNTIHSLYHWTKTAEAMFTFKYVIITIALWIPGVLRSTANFYYVQKGLWALIMAQTTMNIFASDQIFNLFTRLLGTIIGLVLGLAAWYMGNGHGNGNPYGAAASMAFWCFPLVFLRLYAPPQYLTGLLLACATFALIVGYSWIDGNLPSYGSPGIGWNVAWRRFVLVSIGAAASFIIMMLPPQSGRKAVRRRNAALISALSNLYGFLVATWISEDRLSSRDTGDSDSDVEEPDGYTHTSPALPWLKEFRQRLLSLGDEVNAIRGLTALAKWEGNVRGKWPAEDYNDLVETEAEMISPLAQLGGALLQMDDEWRLKFLHNTKILNPHFITEVMSVFSVVSQSLKTAEPLHEVLPQKLVGRFFYHHHSHHHVHAASSRDNEHQEHDLVTAEQITSLEYMYYATAVVSVFQLLQCLDELHRITRKLCGEIPLKGFVNWRDQFDRSHVQV
uniref:ER transporter 6TM N-terminal domain-containing protein n=1 Tax=Moniliophthora roreri TaxID=221103 RepID=A0A0W0FWJ3_MONRR